MFSFLFFEGRFELGYEGLITFILVAYALATSLLFDTMRSMKSASHYKPNAAFGGFLGLIALLVYVAANEIGWLDDVDMSWCIAFLLAAPFLCMGLWHFIADRANEWLSRKEVREVLGYMIFYGGAAWVFIFTQS